MTIQYDNLNSTISAVGSATNIPVNIQPKGTGGLNVLGSGTNLLQRSQALATSPWINFGTVTATNNNAVAPDSTTTATTIALSASSGVYQAVTGIGLTTYTFSIYLRAASAVSVNVIINTNLSDAVTTVASVTTSWQRFTISKTTSSGTSSITSQISVGVSPVTVEAWGAQTEFGSVANTYIPTTTTAIYGTPTLTFSGVAGLGLQSDGSLYVQPAGVGAIQAQATTSTTAGGNARGQNAVDWSTIRGGASQVASGPYTVVCGGLSATNTSFAGVIVGGNNNQQIGSYGFIGAGESNAVGGLDAVVVGGKLNSANGYFNFIGSGFTNSGTASAAVTTQSATMNGTTAVTLSGSNASIRVGQYITGTSIGSDTYVAAISGTSLTLSKIATGSTTNTISFFTPHGVVVGGGNNQATGSYSFIGGGGDAGNTGNRNTASGDWSVVCGGQRNTASGIASFVGGGGTSPPFGTFPNTASQVGSAVVCGFLNTASGGGSFVGSGYINTANGQYSAIMGGQSGITRGVSGNHVFPACQEPISSVQGVSQAALLILARQTTDATPTALASNTAAAGTTNQVILPNNSAYFFTGEVISGVTGGGDTKGWTIEGVIKRGANAASTALVGTPTVTSMYADVGAATWAIAVTADTTNGGIRVTFTGQAATTIRTVAQIRTTEMTF